MLKNRKRYGMYSIAFCFVIQLFVLFLQLVPV